MLIVKTVSIAVAGLLVALLGLAATKADTFRVQRTTRIQAPPEGEGNGKVGKGRMEITDASPLSKVTIKLDFVRPIEGHNVAEFTLKAEGDSTGVTWAMQGPNPYIAKVMSIFLIMDNMRGKEFETGLANLKALTEK